MTSSEIITRVLELLYGDGRRQCEALIQKRIVEFQRTNPQLGPKVLEIYAQLMLASVAQIVSGLGKVRTDLMIDRLAPADVEVWRAVLNQPEAEAFFETIRRTGLTLIDESARYVSQEIAAHHEDNLRKMAAPQ